MENRDYQNIEEQYKNYYDALVYENMDLGVCIVDNQYSLGINELIEFYSPESLMHFHLELFNEFEEWYLINNEYENGEYYGEMEVSNSVELKFRYGRMSVSFEELYFNSIHDLYQYYRAMITYLMEEMRNAEYI